MDMSLVMISAGAPHLAEVTTAIADEEEAISESRGYVWQAALAHDAAEPAMNMSPVKDPDGAPHLAVVSEAAPAFKLVTARSCHSNIHISKATHEGFPVVSRNHIAEL
jgi:hypothetical protein